ncbi:hypothetical protein K0B03_02400 [Patescibacteria group bacterium]|nr:hypothetical protein [Patescibacteria group bacterium]
MSFKKTIIGNERILHILEKGYKSGKLSHAYLFNGPSHIGKRTLALGFCKLLLSDDRQDISDNVDLIILGPDEDKKQIIVEQIRELEKKICLYPYYSKYKVVIIEQAELMNKTAANAVLKTLEEPNKTTIIILLVSNSKNLPDTVKSRCQVFNFLPVKRKVLEEYLFDKIKDQERINEIIEFSGYKPGKIIEFIEDGQKIEALKDDIQRFVNVSSKSYFEKIEEAETVSKMEISEIINLINLYSFYYRNIILKKYQEKKKNFDIFEISRLRDNINLLNTTRENILTKNVNIKLAIENLFLQM